MSLMRFFVNRVVLSLELCATLLVSSLVAQQPSNWRKGQALRQPYAIPGVEAGVLSAAAGSKELKWELIGAATTLVDTYALPGAMHGDIHALGGRRFLVCGSEEGSTGKGYLAVLELRDSPTKRIVVTLGPLDLGTGIDAYNAVWNSQDKYLYLLDYKGKRILAAQWQGVPAALPAQFSMIADSNGIETLESPAMLRLFSPAQMDGVMVGAGKYAAYATRPTPRVYPSGGQWKIQVHKLGYADETYAISSRMFINSRGPLYFSGGSGLVHISETGTGVQVADLHLPGSGPDFAAVNLPDPNLLIPGLSYSIRWPDQTEGGQFRPLLRYGEPQSSGGVFLRRGFANPSRAFLGSLSFIVAAPLLMDPVPVGTFSQAVQSQLFVAARLADGSDPIQIVGDAAILQPVNVLGPWSHILDEEHPMRNFAELQSLGSDVNLAGAVILWQWVVTWGQEGIAYSDVFGTTIFADESQSGLQALVARSRPVSRRRKTIETSLKKAVVASAWRWMGRPTGAIAATKLERAKVLLGMMKRQALRQKKSKSP